MKNIQSIKPFQLVIIAIISALIQGLSNKYFYWGTGLIMYSGLFYYLIKEKPSHKTATLLLGTTFMLQGIILFFWMKEVANNYTGSNSATGVYLIFGLSLVLSIKTTIPFLFFNFIQQKQKRIAFLIIGTAACFVITDWLFSIIFKDIPWLLYFAGYTQSTNILFSQLAELGGVWIITFFVLIINIVISYLLISFKKNLLFFTIVIVALIHIYGYARIHTIKIPLSETINISLICDHSTPRLRWKEKNVNKYVHQLFDLNKEALKFNPDLVVWNEGVIPWSYQYDDDFLDEIVKQTDSANVEHMLSYFTMNEGFSFNSVYLFNNRGHVIDRNDKHLLLAGLEKPLWNVNSWQLSFFSDINKSKTIENSSIKPVKSAKGYRFGTLICNESLVDNITACFTLQDIDFFILIANNNWFVNTSTIKTHLYATRLRAIETRKSIVINSNMGYCGIINSKGELQDIVLNNKPEVLNVQINTNNRYSNYYTKKNIFLILSFFLMLIPLYKLKQ